MDNIIMFELPLLDNQDSDINFSFSMNNNYDLENITLDVRETKNMIDRSINYSESLDKDLDKMNKYTYLTLSEYNAINLKEPSNDIFEDNLLFKKIEFDHQNDKSVVVRVEFQADTKEDAQNIKNKAEALGIKVIK